MVPDLPSSSVGASRDALRRWAKGCRQRLPLPEISHAVGRHLVGLPGWDTLDWVLGFYPRVGPGGAVQEIDLRSVMTVEGVGPRWYLPKVEGDGEGMAFYPYRGESTMAPGAFGIQEPSQESSREGQVPWSVAQGGRGLVLVPALCVDGAGGRLGYGKGYYDRFLSSQGLKGRVPLLAVVPEGLRVANIPQEGHDVAVDGVVTEGGVTWFSPIEEGAP